MAIAPEYGGLIADDLIKSYRSVGREADGLAVLKKHYLRHPTLDTFNVVFREMRAQQGHDVAWEFARDALRAQPSLLGLDRLLEIELAAGDRSSLTQITSDADLSLLRSLIHKHTQRLDRYACNVCGFEARHFYWQCPGCNSWETYQPLRLEEVK